MLDIVFRIPTVYLLYQENLDFRSPHANYDNGAYCVNSNGVVNDGGWDIDRSYGQLSGQYACGRNVWFLSGESHLAKWLYFL